MPRNFKFRIVISILLKNRNNFDQLMPIWKEFHMLMDTKMTLNN